MATLNRALNMLAAGDHGIVAELRERWQRPDVRVQDAAPPVAKILARHWSTVLRIAYDLAPVGVLYDHELRTHLNSGPDELRIKAREGFQQGKSRRSGL
ncbi:hypothetical protein [Streptomyces endophytica]|uniref:Uncharacterized protein n=1 Tax=Streptomyces endophytica TaxID=2991496 RepID=A0ABY6PK16_9ACTN|nr:hypothetical protein [Streptomyces endophytica]UZJ33502.1 hypothetical protein OJ254_28520 [Streptomyces endophytica]